MTDHLISVSQQSAEGEGSRVMKRVPCEVYSRIVGYLRPVRDWNKGKQQEFADRKTYAVSDEHPRSE